MQNAYIVYINRVRIAVLPMYVRIFGNESKKERKKKKIIIHHTPKVISFDKLLITVKIIKKEKF